MLSALSLLAEKSEGASAVRIVIICFIYIVAVMLIGLIVKEGVAHRKRANAKAHAGKPVKQAETKDSGQNVLNDTQSQNAIQTQNFVPLTFEPEELADNNQPEEQTQSEQPVDFVEEAETQEQPAEETNQETVETVEQTQEIQEQEETQEAQEQTESDQPLLLNGGQTYLLTHKTNEDYEEAPVEQAEGDEGDDIMRNSAKDKDDVERVEREKFVVNGRVIYIMYNRSFTAKLIQADPVLQDRYSQLKNEILSYGARARMSWQNDSFSVGRNTVAKFGIRGKTLSLYLALDPAKYEDTKYIYDDVSEIKKYAGVPMRVKLRSDRSVKWTKELIADLMQNNEKEQGEIPDTVYSYPYETTEELVRKALIKVYTNGSGKEQEVTYADFDALKHERFKEITGLDILPKVTAAKAEESITDEEAKKFIHYEEVPKPQPEVEEEKQPEVKEEKPKNEHKEHKQVKPQPKKIIAQPATSNKKVKGIINIDVISINFEKDDIVTLKEMKEKGLIDKKVTYVKVLARGEIDKPLDIVADDFSLQAVKMIVMTGGSVTEIARN